MICRNEGQNWPARIQSICSLEISLSKCEARQGQAINLSVERGKDISLVYTGASDAIVFLINLHMHMVVYILFSKDVWVEMGIYIVQLNCQSSAGRTDA